VLKLNLRKTIQIFLWPGPGETFRALAVSNRCSMRSRVDRLALLPTSRPLHSRSSQYRLNRWRDAERAFLLCVRQAPLFSAAFRMLGEIARWHKRDPAEQALYQVKVLESRRQLRNLRRRKTSEFSAARTTSNRSRESRTMPVLRSHPEAL